MLLRYLVAFNIAVSITLWIPSWLKMWRLKSSREYSALSFAAILYLQLSNLLIALKENAPLMVIYMATNALAVGLTCALIRKYRKGRDAPAPRPKGC